MFADIMYAEEKIRQLRADRISAQVRRTPANRDAETPRTGVGLVHEVFRRIAEVERPEPQQHRRRWLAAGR